MPGVKHCRYLSHAVNAESFDITLDSVLADTTRLLYGTQWVKWKLLLCAEDVSDHGHASQAGRLSYVTFDLDRVLNNSAFLMGSEGKEYDVEEESTIGQSLFKLTILLYELVFYSILY